MPYLPSTPITKIHGKYYNLQHFQHPGGVFAKEIAYGRDATELFESHHRFIDRKRLLAILESYRIDHPEDTISSNEAFDWEKTYNAPFTQELFSFVRHQLPTTNDSKITLTRCLEITGLFLLFATQYFFFTSGWWFSALTVGITYWMFIANVFHDATHFAVSFRFPVLNTIFSFVGFPLSLRYNWVHQHIIGHHAFTNLPGRDPDLYQSLAFARSSPDVSWKEKFSYQPITFVIPFVFATLSLLLHDSVKNMRGEDYLGVVPLSRTRAVHPRWIPLQLLFSVSLIYAFPVSFLGIGKGLCFGLLSHTALSCCFMICSQVNHFVEETEGKRDENFFIHQILSSHNMATDSYVTRLFTGYLNFQIEHHLFPSVNHVHLPKLAAGVKQLCRKYNVEYHESPSLWVALKKHWEYVYKLSKPN